MILVSISAIYLNASLKNHYNINKRVSFYKLKIEKKFIKNVKDKHKFFLFNFRKILAESPCIPKEVLLFIVFKSRIASVL